MLPTQANSFGFAAGALEAAGDSTTAPAASASSKASQNVRTRLTLAGPYAAPARPDCSGDPGGREPGGAPRLVALTAPDDHLQARVAGHGRRERVLLRSGRRAQVGDELPVLARMRRVDVQLGRF